METCLFSLHSHHEPAGSSCPKEGNMETANNRERREAHIPGSSEYIAEKLAHLSEEERRNIQETLSRFQKNWNPEYVVGLITGQVKTSLVGSEIKIVRAFNAHNLDANDVEGAGEKWERWHQMWEALPDLQDLGILPRLNQLGDLNFTLAFHPGTAKDYWETHPEISLGEFTVGAAFYMAAQIGKVSYSAFTKTGETTLIEGGKVLVRPKGFQTHANSSGVSHHDSGRSSAWQRGGLTDRYGKVIELTTPGHLTLPVSMNADWWDIMVKMFGLDYHAAYSDGQKLVLATSERGTEDEWGQRRHYVSLHDSWHIPGTTDNAGKTLAKRMMPMKMRRVFDVIYGNKDDFENPFEVPVATWRLNHGDIKVAVSHSPNNAGDGWAGSTRPRMMRVLRSLGLTRHEARGILRETEAFHNVGTLPFKVAKGNILLYTEEHWQALSIPEEAKSEADIVFDAASFSDTPMSPDLPTQMGMYLDPISVNQEELFRIMNAEQMAFEGQKLIDHAIFPELPHIVMGELREAFVHAHSEHLAKVASEAAREETPEEDAAAPKPMGSKHHNLFTEAANLGKRHYFSVGNGMYDSRHSMRKFAGSTFSKVSQLIVELATKGYSGLMLPMGYCRIHTGFYSPVWVDKGSIYALRKEGKRLPFVIFVDDPVFTDLVFKWRMEFVDGDDAVYHVTLIDEKGDYYVLLLKTPTSPNGGTVLPISEAVAKELGTPALPMKRQEVRLLQKELAEMLQKGSQYTPVRMDNSASGRYRNQLVKVTPNTTSTAYAHQTAKISHLTGSLGRFSDLGTLASRSGLWQHLPRKQYVEYSFLQMSLAVDATLLRTETINPMINQLADNIIREIHDGRGIDRKFLFQPAKKGLVEFLTRRYQTLRRQKVINGLKPPMLDENGVISPNHAEQFDPMWESIGSIPQRLLPILHRNASLLHAVSNGPLHNFTRPVSASAASLAEKTWKDIDEERMKWGPDWSSRERRYLELAENAQVQMIEQPHGEFSAAMAQCHAALDNLYSLGRMPVADTVTKAVSKLELEVDWSLPTGINMPVVEYQDREEIKAFFNAKSIPTVFMQVNRDNTLVEGNLYQFHTTKRSVAIRGAAEESDKGRRLTTTSARRRQSFAAVCPTQKGREWAKAAEGVEMTFRGFVHWSLEGEVAGRRCLPVAIFEPNMEQLLQWEVD